MLSKKKRIQGYLYSISGATNSMLYNLFTTYIQFYFTDVIKLPANLVGRGWFIFGFWNTVNDPFSGRISDKVKKKFGERKSLIKLLLLPVVISFTFLWLPRLFESNRNEFIYFLLVISLFDGLYSMLDVNLNAVMPELFKSIKVRTHIVLVKSVLILIFVAVTVGIAPVVYSRFGWTFFGIVIAFVALLLYLFSLAGIRERIERSDELSVSFWLIVVNFFKKEYFLKLVSLQFFIRVVQAIVLAILPFYGKYVLYLSDNQSGILIGAVLGSSLIFLPVWERITVKVGTKYSMVICLVSTLLATSLLFFNTDKLLSVLILAFIAGLYSGAPNITTVMSTEVIDQDKEREGKNRTGLIYGLMGMANRFPPAIAGLVLGEILSKSGYMADIPAFDQPIEVSAYLQNYLVFGLIAGLILAIGITLTLVDRGRQLKLTI